MYRNFLTHISVLIIPLYFISTFIVGKMGDLFESIGLSQPLADSFTVLFSSPLTWLIAFLIVRKREKQFKYRFSSGEPGNIPLILLATIGIQYGIISPIVSFIPVSPAILSIVEKAFALIPLSSIIISVVIISPFFEELIYRGLVLDSLLKNKSRWIAILIASFIYAFIHFNPYQFCSVFLLSLFIGWIYSYTRNIGACILIHFVSNATEIAIAYIKNPDGLAHDLITTAIDWDSRITVVFTGISFIIALFSLYELHYYYNQRQHDKLPQKRHS